MIRLLRMARWARRPPSARRAVLVVAVVAGCLLVVAAERWLGSPAAPGGNGTGSRAGQMHRP